MLLLLAGEPFHRPEARRLPLLLKSLVILLNCSLVGALEPPETSPRLSVGHGPSSPLTLPCPCVSHPGSSCRGTLLRYGAGGVGLLAGLLGSMHFLRVLGALNESTSDSLVRRKCVWLSTREAESQCREKNRLGTQIIWGTGTQEIDFWKWWWHKANCEDAPCFWASHKLSFEISMPYNMLGKSHLFCYSLESVPDFQERRREPQSWTLWFT